MKFSALLFGLSSGLPIYNYVLAKHLAKNYNAPTLNMPTLNLNPLTADHKGFASEVIIPGMIADQTEGSQKSKMNWYFWMKQNAPQDLINLGNLAMIPMMQGEIRAAPKAEEYVYVPAAKDQSSFLGTGGQDAFWNAQGFEDVWYPRGDVKSNW